MPTCKTINIFYISTCSYYSMIGREIMFHYQVKYVKLVCSRVAGGLLQKQLTDQFVCPKAVAKELKENIHITIVSVWSKWPNNRILHMLRGLQDVGVVQFRMFLPLRSEGCPNLKIWRSHHDVEVVQVWILNSFEKLWYRSIMTRDKPPEICS